MKLKNAEIKNLVVDVIYYEDGVDENNKKIRRTSFKKDLMKGVRQVKDVILKNTLVGYAPKDKSLSELKAEDILLIDAGAAAPEGMRPIVEKFKDEEIELSPIALKAFFYYYNIRDEIPEVSEQTLEEIELAGKSVI